MIIWEQGIEGGVVWPEGLMSCTPNAIATHPGNGSRCVESTNKVIKLSHNGLKSLVHQFNDATKLVPHL